MCFKQALTRTVNLKAVFTADELNCTELTCTKLTQLNDALLVTRVSSITKLIGCRAAVQSANSAPVRELQFSSVLLL